METDQHIKPEYPVNTQQKGEPMKDRMRVRPVVLEVFLVTFIMTAMAPLSVRAEYYRYTDQSGVVRYTDNLLDVPEAQRSRVEKYIGKNDQSEDAIPVDAPSDDDVEKKSEQMNPVDSKQLEFEYLSQEKAEIDKEYDMIIKEKNDLTLNKAKMDIEVYNKKALQFNERIAAYEERRKAFEEAANAFNSQIK
jgi:hypothetical protein